MSLSVCACLSLYVRTCVRGGQAGGRQEKIQKDSQEKRKRQGERSGVQTGRKTETEVHTSTQTHTSITRESYLLYRCRLGGGNLRFLGLGLAPATHAPSVAVVEQLPLMRGGLNAFASALLVQKLGVCPQAEFAGAGIGFSITAATQETELLHFFVGGSTNAVLQLTTISGRLRATIRRKRRVQPMTSCLQACMLL